MLSMQKESSSKEIELTLYENDVKIGYCRCSISDSEAIVDVIRVAKPFRKKGLATLLLSNIEHEGFIINFPSEEYLSDGGKILKEKWYEWKERKRNSEMVWDCLE